jgi:RHH-type transcriptional regulator, rel operon repressor / antitoxin RelB
MYTARYKVPQMTTTLSVRIDTLTKKRLEALAKRARRSKSFLAAEAIAAFVEAESWQLDEIQIGIKDTAEVVRDEPIFLRKKIEDLRDARRSSCLARISGSRDTRHRTRRFIETRLVDEAGGPDPLRLSIAVLGL